MNVWVPMSVSHLDAVMSIEQRCYLYPWTRGNFADALAAGYWAQLLQDPNAQCLAYTLAMPGVDEMHLLNITVDTPHQHQGHARWMLNALKAECAARHLPHVFLEVRPSNLRAHALYAAAGFVTVGLRKNYYPAANGQREDAAVMRWAAS
jgi:[ribosomal protein S18]-alanine N-acetyltransferase